MIIKKNTDASNEYQNRKTNFIEPNDLKVNSRKTDGLSKMDSNQKETRQKNIRVFYMPPFFSFMQDYCRLINRYFWFKQWVL